MAKIQIDGLHESKGIVRRLHPRGMYKFRVRSFEPTQSRSGNTQFVARMEIVEGPDEESSSGVYTHYFTITEAQFTKDKLRNFLDACGVPVSKDSSFNPSNIADKECYGMMVHRTDEMGTVRSQVSIFYPEKNASRDED